MEALYARLAGAGRRRSVALMPALRVLHVGKFYPPAPGGMEKMVQLLCEGERPGVDSRVLVANTSPRTVRETLARRSRDARRQLRVDRLGRHLPALPVRAGSRARATSRCCTSPIPSRS